MKRMISLLICIALFISLGSCGSKEGSGNRNDAAQDTESNTEEKAHKSDVDIDLTTLSSTMVYAQVYEMMNNPDDFLGKTVRASGPFAVYTDEASGKNYFACIIKDATACCAQGMEFELEGDHSYPEDYPELNTEITVEGTFDKYQEGETTYCTLRKAVLR